VTVGEISGVLRRPDGTRSFLMGKELARVGGKVEGRLTCEGLGWWEKWRMEHDLGEGKTRRRNPVTDAGAFHPAFTEKQQKKNSGRGPNNTVQPFPSDLPRNLFPKKFPQIIVERKEPTGQHHLSIKGIVPEVDQAVYNHRSPLFPDFSV